MAESLSTDRAAMANRYNLNRFYEILGKAIADKKITDASQVYNVDEAGFSYHVSRNRVVTTIGKRNVHNVTYGEKGKSFTFIGCASAAGRHGPHGIVFDGKVKPTQEMLEAAPPNTVLYKSENGYISKRIFLDWLAKFCTMRKGQPTILLMDNHASHTCLEVLSMARCNNVALVAFPSHCTHVLQPLDVAVYRPMKTEFTKAIQEFRIESPHIQPTKVQMERMIHRTFTSAFRKRTVRRAFSATGIWPFNKDAVSETKLSTSLLTAPAIPEELIINPDDPEEMTIVPDPESEADIEMSLDESTGEFVATSSLEHQQSGSAMIDTAQLLIEDPVVLGRRADAVLDEIFKMHKVIRKYRPSAILVLCMLSLQLRYKLVLGLFRYLLTIFLFFSQ